MAHVRIQIRDAIVTALGATLPTTGATVWTSRAWQIAEDQMPAVNVTLADESAEGEIVRLAGGVYAQQRRLVVQIEVATKAASGADTDAQAVCSEVEQLVMADPTLGGACKWIQLDGADFGVSAETDRPVALATMRFAADYRVDVRDPETAIG